MKKWVALIVISTLLLLGSLGLLLQPGTKTMGAKTAPIFWLAILILSILKLIQAKAANSKNIEK